MNKMTKVYFRKALTLGTWLMLPMNGSVLGPGGNFRGRQLATKYFDRTNMTKIAPER
jgi:hypothetical protein